MYGSFQETNRWAVFIWFQPSYVAPCKQQIQSCSMETTFPHVQNWKISPPFRLWIQHHWKGTEKNDRRGPRYYRVSTKGSWTAGEREPFLSFSLSRPSYLALSPCAMHRALPLFSSALKRGHLWHWALFSQGGAIWKAICAFVRTIAITGRAGLMMMARRLLSVPLQVVPDRRTNDRKRISHVAPFAFLPPPPFFASSRSFKSYLVESIVILYTRGQRKFLCRSSYQRVYDKNRSRK